MTVAFLLLLSQNIIPGCACDSAKPETMESRTCSLSREADKQPPELEIFFLKDINPRKPNRTLALPRQQGPKRYTLDQLSLEERTKIWSEAIEKARSLWGEDWAVAYNGDDVRTQCHVHVHIGKLNSAAKVSSFVEVSSPHQIPAPNGKGIWVYGNGKKIRVHHGEQITETALIR